MDGRDGLIMVERLLRKLPNGSYVQRLKSGYVVRVSKDRRFESFSADNLAGAFEQAIGFVEALNEEEKKGDVQ